MPIHDWTRVDDGVFHDVHLGWIAEMRRALNGGVLPPGFYAMAEQVLGGGSPDVLALERPTRHSPAVPPDSQVRFAEPAVAMLTAPPRTRLVFQAERESYTTRQRRLVIRHRSGHRVVALIEIVSAGNKSSGDSWRSFLNKALAALQRGIHLLILDLHPRTPRDPEGTHGSIWRELTGEGYQAPDGLDRTLVAYSAGMVKTAYVEPVAVGQRMPDMPLFLTPDGEGHIEVPLEATFLAAYAPLDQFYRDILEGSEEAI